jgi:hypothetical protein
MTTDPSIAPIIDLVKEEITGQQSRKASLEQRGIAVITTAGTLVTLLLALAALVTSTSVNMVLPPLAHNLLLGSLLSFVLAALLGLAVNAPVPYPMVEPKDVVKGVENKEWEGSNLVAERRAVRWRAMLLPDMHDMNQLKAKILALAIGAEVIAIIFTAATIWAVIDTTPTPKLDKRPDDPANSTRATFSFSSSRSNVRFECRLDNGGFSPCASPRKYAGLTAGRHVFQVRAVGDADEVSAETSSAWTIDTMSPPKPEVRKAQRMSSRGVKLIFSAGEVGVSFMCRLDTGRFSTCESPKTYVVTKGKEYTFSIKAIDAAGNESSMESYKWQA